MMLEVSQSLSSYHHVVLYFRLISLSLSVTLLIFEFMCNTNTHTFSLSLAYTHISTLDSSLRRRRWRMYTTFRSSIWRCLSPKWRGIGVTLSFSYFHTHTLIYADLLVLHITLLSRISLSFFSIIFTTYAHNTHTQHTHTISFPLSRNEVDKHNITHTWEDLEAVQLRTLSFSSTSSLALFASSSSSLLSLLSSLSPLSLIVFKTEWQFYESVAKMPNCTISFDYISMPWTQLISFKFI